MAIHNSFFEKIGYGFYRILWSLKKDGFQTTVEKICYRMRHGNYYVNPKYYEGRLRDPDRIYRAWRKKNFPDEKELMRMKAQSRHFSYQPLFSIVLPTYNPNLSFLQETIQSVFEQCYHHWEICICEDGSKGKKVKPFIQNLMQKEPRIQCHYKQRNEGIISASHAAAAMARGEFLIFLDQDDLLYPDALYRVAERLNQHPDCDLLYSDNDKVNLDGTYEEPYFKPDFSPEELLCHNYMGHLCVIRKKLFDSIGGFRAGYEGAQDYDLLLRAVEKSGKIEHIPYVLYGWRKTPGSTASSPVAKGYAYDSGKQALQDYMNRRGFNMRVEESKRKGVYRFRLSQTKNAKVSIVIAVSDPSWLTLCVRSILDKTSYPSYELILVGEEQTLLPVSGFPFQCKQVQCAKDLSVPKKLNLGKRQSSSDYLIFLDEKSEIISDDWIEALLEHLQIPGVGCVGSKILCPEGRIQQGGLIIGLGSTMDFAFRRVPDNALIYNDPHHIPRNCTAVSIASLATTTHFYDFLGGLDESLPALYSGLDFCFRLREANYRIVWTPFSIVCNRDQTFERENLFSEIPQSFLDKWKRILNTADPYYNINLTKRYFDFSPDMEAIEEE